MSCYYRLTSSVFLHSYSVCVLSDLVLMRSQLYNVSATTDLHHQFSYIPTVFLFSQTYSVGVLTTIQCWLYYRLTSLVFLHSYRVCVLSDLQCWCVQSLIMLVQIKTLFVLYRLTLSVLLTYLQNWRSYILTVLVFLPTYKVGDFTDLECLCS